MPCWHPWKKKNGIKLKYKVRNSKKTKEQTHVRGYTYDFRRSVVTDN
jgi:hypothetical protein